MDLRKKLTGSLTGMRNKTVLNLFPVSVKE